MLTREQNERLVRVGPGTPAGELFRRYWQPAVLSEEVPEKDGAPLRVRLLGEDLVAFRRFFIRHDLQLHHISSREDERGSRLSQHRGQTTTVKPRAAGEEDDFVLQREEIGRHSTHLDL